MITDLKQILPRFCKISNYDKPQISFRIFYCVLIIIGHWSLVSYLKTILFKPLFGMECRLQISLFLFIIQLWLAVNKVMVGWMASRISEYLTDHGLDNLAEILTTTFSCVFSYSDSNGTRFSFPRIHMSNDIVSGYCWNWSEDIQLRKQIRTGCTDAHLLNQISMYCSIINH